MRPLTPRRAALVLLGLVLVPAAALAQGRRPTDAGGTGAATKPVAVPGDGTEVLRGLLDYLKIKPVTERELLSASNRFDDVILISLGDPRGAIVRQPGFTPLLYLNRVIENRGAVLVATDTDLPLPVAGESIWFTGNRVECNDLNSIHARRRHCPYAVPSRDAADDDLRAIFRGLDRVATNSPTYLTDFARVGGPFQRIAEFPRGCLEEGLAALSPRAAFAIGGEGPDWQPYRFLGVADHSLFINQMLLEPGTDNLELTYRVIHYLQGPGKTRTRCLFFENGRHVERFDDLRQAFGRQNPLPIPQVNLWALQDKFTDLGNSVIDRLQANDVPNRMVFGSSDPAGQYRTLSMIMRFFLVAAAIYALWFVARRAWGSRKPGDVPPPPAVAGAPTGPPGVFDRRQKELLRRNNVYEPIRDLVREFFDSLGIHGEQGPRLPKVVVSDVVRKPDSLRAAVRDLWRIAFGPPQVLTVNRWRELEPYFARVRQAHADGKWRFVLAEETTGSVA